jgi:hypothetical protein
MSHFAKVVDGKVVRVIVAEQEFIDTYVDSEPGKWVQTSYNTFRGIHYGPDGQPDGGVALRGNYAGIGFVYDKENDVFYEEKLYPSWILDTTTWTWEAPISKPIDNKTYKWDESTISWIELSESV